MKNYIKILPLLLILWSCEDFTEVGLPADQVTRDLVFRDDALASSAMAGVYRGLEASGFLSGGSSGWSLYMGCYTDELVSYAAATADTSSFYLLTHNAASSRVYSIWSATYKQIYNVNSMIEGLQASSMLTSGVKDKLLGESLFIRALLHLYLMKTFGAVPYVATTDYEINQSIARKSPQEVYQLAHADLLLALEKLPVAYAKGLRIRPSKGTAKALLARIAYEQKNWDEAVAYASEVISDPQYPMETLVEKTFLKESSSALWQLMPYEPTYNALEGNYYILKTAPPPTVAFSSGFMNGFETGDARQSKWIGEIKDTGQVTYYYPFKYKQQTNTAATLEYSVIMRIEELYLIRAEAFIENGQTALGLADLNKLRNRAGLPSVTGTDKAFLLEALLKERRYEFFTEWGQRFYDLKHFGKLDQKMLPVKPSWKNTYGLLPIPEKELLINPALNPQNNGY